MQFGEGLGNSVHGREHRWCIWQHLPKVMCTHPTSSASQMDPVDLLTEISKNYEGNLIMFIIAIAPNWIQRQYPSPECVTWAHWSHSTYKINKSWGCNVVHLGEYNQWYCNNFVWWQMVTRFNCEHHLIVYKNLKSLWCIPETKRPLFVNYT